MSNVFDIKRFGNFFLYDLRRAKNNYGLSLIILGTLPISVYLLTQFISLIRGNGITMMDDSLKFMLLVIAFVIALFGAGAKLYGFVTDKKTGSEFLVLPASTFEKWLSVVLMVCFVLPLVLAALLFMSDAVMRLVFPGSYGDMIFSNLLSGQGQNMFQEEEWFVNTPALLVLTWVQDILIFTLGAVCFKKAKVGKTLLVLLGVAMVVSLLMVAIAGGSNVDPAWIEAHFEDAQSAASFVNWTLNIFYIIVIGGLLGGLYYRLRTIKH